MTDGIYRELPESGIIKLRFKSQTFHCEDALFYPDPAATHEWPQGYNFKAFPKPGQQFMFFGKDANDRFEMQSEDMCHATHTQDSDYGNLYSDMPIKVISQLACQNCLGANYLGQDLEVGNSALINFQHAYTGPLPVHSPFAFSDPSTGNPYFVCADSYTITLKIPAFYQLDSVIHYPDPNVNNTAGGVTLPIPLPSSVVELGIPYNIFTFPNLSFGVNGDIAANVTLTNCPDGGGINTFTATVQAFCNNCLNCPNTIAIITAQAIRHCNTPCWPGYSPQNTTSFAYARLSHGIQNGPPSNLRAYGCDLLQLDIVGVTVPQANNMMAVRIDYDPGISYQFLEVQNGSLSFDGDSGQPYLITGSTAPELSGTFLGTGGWPLSSAPPYYLFVNFSDASNPRYSALRDAIQNPGPTVNLHLTLIVKVRPVSPPCPPGVYTCGLTAQFWSGLTGTAGLGSCDPHLKTLSILGVTVEPVRSGFSIARGRTLHQKGSIWRSGSGWITPSFPGFR